MKNIIMVAAAIATTALCAGELTFEQALAKANKGDADAQWQLALMYKVGNKGAPHSFEDAIKWYTKAVDAGHARAMCGLGRMYEEGQGVEKSPTEAMNLYLQSAANGYARAYSFIGYMYEDGVGVQKSYKKALSYFLKGANKGDPLSQCNAGRCYAHGLGCKVSGSDAVKWLTKAAEQKSAYACEQLGFYYKTGFAGLPKSEAAALKYYRLGAEYGSDECKKQVSDLTAAGKVEYDEWSKVVLTRAQQNAKPTEKENTLLKKSAEKGYAPAQWVLAEVFFAEAQKSDDESKYAEAIVWYRKAAAQGNTEAMKQLSCLYGLGKGCKLSYSESFYWAEKGSKTISQLWKNGDPMCKILLANLYTNGLGCQKSDEKAFELIREAATQTEMDYPQAWYQLGLRYISGEGTPKSLELGVHWLKKAANAGNNDADELLMSLSGETYVPPTRLTLGCKIRFNDPTTKANLGITAVYPCSEPKGSHLVNYTPTDVMEVNGLGQRSWAIVLDGRVISMTDAYTIAFNGNKAAAVKKAVNLLCAALDMNQQIVGSGQPFEVDSSVSMKKAKQLLPVGCSTRARVTKALEISQKSNPSEELYITLRSHSRTIDSKEALEIETDSVTYRSVTSIPDELLSK